MQKVVGVNLNGNAYQVEQRGYDSLLAYLDRAQVRLANNPDRAEIIVDLEQAIAEKCNKVLGPHKSVVTAEEIDRVLAEMGPVDSDEPGAESPRDQSTTDASNAKEHPSDATAPRRLYQIRDGAMISGVCNGIAAYIGMDVTLVRIAFVLLAVLTKGVWLLVYAVLAFVIPYAETSEDHAAAHGRPFTAQGLIDQARRNYTDFKTNKDWRRHWRQQRREWRRQWRYGLRQELVNARGYPWGASGGPVAPVLGLAHAGLALLLVLALISLGTTRAVFGYRLPAGIPFWAGFLILIVVYQMLASVLVMPRAVFAYPRPAGVWIAPGITLLWWAIVIASVWYGYHHVPQVHDFIQRLPAAWDAFVHALGS